MHEATLAQIVIDDIERRIANGEIAGRVVNISLAIGKLRAVVPDNLIFLFGVLSKGTVLEGAELEIEQVPIRASCRCCGMEFEIEDVYFSCRGCGSSDMDVLTGSELLIESVEVD